MIDELGDRIMKEFILLRPETYHYLTGDGHVDKKAKDIDFVMPMYNLIEYSNNYLEMSESLWQCRQNGSYDNITDSDSFKYKSRLASNTNSAGIANV